MRPVTIWAPLIACCLFLIAAGGCTQSAAPKSGETAPAISCTDVKGDYVSLGQLRGNVVVLFFWSGKCCGDSLVKLQPFFQGNKGRGLSIVAVEVGGSKETVSSFVASNKLTFVNLTDEYGGISKTYRVIGFPTIFIIDRKGVVRGKVSGEIGMDQLGKLVEPFL